MHPQTSDGKAHVLSQEPSEQATRRKRNGRPFPLHQRRKDLARLVVWRHDRLPDDGWSYIKVAAEHCPHGPNRRDALMLWFEHVCAPIPTRRQADDILDRVPPRHWSADALGNHLRLTDAERATLRCYTIGSYQTPKAERIKRRKEKARLAAQARRRANGGKPREQSHSRKKPWEAFGIKRRAWEYRGKPDPAVAQIRTQDTSLPYAYEFAQRMDCEGHVEGKVPGLDPFPHQAPSSLQRQAGSHQDADGSSATTGTSPVAATKVELVAPATAAADFPATLCVDDIAQTSKPCREAPWPHLRRRDGIGRVPIDLRLAQAMRDIAAAVAAGRVPRGVRLPPAAAA